MRQRGVIGLDLLLPGFAVDGHQLRQLRRRAGADEIGAVFTGMHRIAGIPKRRVRLLFWLKGHPQIFKMVMHTAKCEEFLGQPLN